MRTSGRGRVRGDPDRGHLVLGAAGHGVGVPGYQLVDLAGREMKGAEELARCHLGADRAVSRAAPCLLRSSTGTPSGTP